jgi:4-hydroxybutyryl-CoA dehydratase/vinylacetyl-CoA-Delta-isomerase
MTLMSRDEYFASLQTIPRQVFIRGEQVAEPSDHPLIRPSLNACAMTYALAEQHAHAQMMKAASDVTGTTVNRFTHLHHNPADLVAKVKMLRLLGRTTGCCFQRCVGMDALNALETVTFEMDRAEGTTYHARFMDFLKMVQQRDLVVNGAMTDAKGDRHLRPTQQPDADLFVRIVERRAEGIVVRGAKLHQTGAVNSHEILLMPTQALTEAEKDYAVACAIPAGAPGVLMILGRQPSDGRRLEHEALDTGNREFGGHEALVVFEDVFVPWERVFMAGETAFCGMLVERFAAYHRQSYGGCKAGVGDVLIGASQARPVPRAWRPLVREKIVEMIHLNETLYACGIACSAEGHPADSGTYLVDPLLANVCKLNVTRAPFEIARLAQDIAGGLLATLPSARDLENPVTGPHVRKYLRGAEQRQRIASACCGWWRT